MNDFSSLGEGLKAIRDKRGSNLSDVSESTGISKAILSEIERGGPVPTTTTIWKVASRLRITLNVLADEVDSNYAVRDTAKTAPLVDDSGFFTLCNIFPSSPLNGVQVFYGVLRAEYYYNLPMFVRESSSKEYCTVFRRELDAVISPKTYHLFEGRGIDFDAHEEHSYTNCGTSKTTVYFLLI